MFDSFRLDAARWIDPSFIGDPSEITPLLALRLLLRHAPLRAVAWYRFGVWCRKRGIPLCYGYASRRIRRVHGLELSCQGEIGGGLYIAHTIGTVVLARSIGKNVSLIAAVTIGMRNRWAFPAIGDGVFVGAGARLLGGIEVGEGASIGANAVVITDVPPGATAVGIPARVSSGARGRSREA
jgi:serine O-acetyltransferase